MRFILHAMAMVGFAFVHMTPLQAAPLAPYHILDQFNLITFTDMDARSDVEGRTLIGGNLKGASAIFFTRPQQAAPSDYAAFTVGGNVSGGYKNINGGGDAMIAGNVQNLNMNGGIAYIGQSITGNVNGNKVTGASVVVPDFKPILSDLSDGLAGLDANSSVITTGGKATFNAAPDSHGVAIFTIADGKSFFNSINEIDFILNSADSIIINVFGTEMTVAEIFSAASAPRSPP